MKTLKDFMEVYRPKSPDEQKFVDKHVTIKHKDRNGNGDDVFKATNIKTIKRKEERHGYDAGEDEKVYEEVEGIDELSRGTLVNYTHKAIHTAMKTSDATPEGKVKREKRLKGAGLAAKKLGYNEEVEEIDELSSDTLRRYRMKAKSIGDNEKGDVTYRSKGRDLAARKTYGGRMADIEKAKVMAKEEVELEEGTMRLSKVHIVHHHDHPAAKEFAKNYTAAMKGDHRETGPSEADDKAADSFHQRYTGIRTRDGFAGSGTHVYTDHKTGAKWKVDKHPNGKTFYGTDHIISHVTGDMHESLEEGEYLDTVAEDRVVRSLVAFYEELGEEILIDDIIDIAEELIDELSKEKLAKYIPAAAKDAEQSGRDQEYYGSEPGGPDDFLRGRNRQKGIQRAVKKLTKEEVVSNALDKYVLKDVEDLPTMEERLVSKLDGLSESHIHLLLSLFDSLNEDNQMKMLESLDNSENINGMIDFAIQNRGE